jgi:histidinol-phosphate/aromatic aminotransferase/cobyric acid decarboxylase-like protein
MVNFKRRTPFYELCDAAESRGILLIISTNLSTNSVKNPLYPHSIQERYGMDVISRLRANCRPWAVNALAIEAGRWLIQHEKSCYREDVAQILAETRYLRERLRGIFGIHVYPTDTNFMLCSIRQSTAAELKEYLLAQHGFLIRDASNFVGLKDCHFRIATQHPDYNDELVAAIYTFTRMKHG